MHSKILPYNKSKLIINTCSPYFSWNLRSIVPLTSTNKIMRQHYLYNNNNQRSQRKTESKRSYNHIIDELKYTNSHQRTHYDHKHITNLEKQKVKKNRKKNSSAKEKQQYHRTTRNNSNETAFFCLHSTQGANTI